jgi:hypothetical protein
MIQPKAFGRLRPRNDWEGDDHSASYVTCADTSGGRAVAWATNGRVDKDGSVYRAVTKDPDGLTLDQLALEIKAVAGLTLILPTGWAWGECSFHLSTGIGLVAQGWYDALPDALQLQPGPNHFVHDIFFCCRSLAGAKLVLEYDPINRDTKGYGRWIPAAAARAFIESGGVTVAYLVNQPV